MKSPQLYQIFPSGRAVIVKIMAKDNHTVASLASSPVAGNPAPQVQAAKPPPRVEVVFRDVLSAMRERVRRESKLLLPLRRCDVHTAFAAQEADAFAKEQEDCRRLRRGRRVPGPRSDAGSGGLGHAGVVCRVGSAGLSDCLDHHAGRARGRNGYRLNRASACPPVVETFRWNVSTSRTLR